MKNIKNLIMVLSILLIGVLIGSTTTKQVNATTQEVNNIEYKARGTNFHIIDNITKPNGDIIQVYNNGSWSLVNEKEDIYIFQAIEFGDYEYNVGNMEDLTNFIATYKSIYENGYY